MRTWTIAGAALVAMTAAGVAVAQQAPPPPPGPPEAPPMGEMRHGPQGHWRGMIERMHGHHMQPPSKAAHFRFRKGDAVVDIKCADDEPTKACVDAGAALLDKLAAQK